MNKILLLITFLFCIQLSYAQRYPRIIKGNVIDSLSGEPIKDVTVTLFKATDTTLVNFSFTTPNGNFEFSTKLKDSMILVISLIGYKEVWKNIPANEWGWWSNEKIKLSKLPYELKEAQIIGSAIRMKGDTIEFSASRFKVMPGSDVSQLFAKIPGFQLDVKGNLTVDGSKVSKIMVDGSDFFGNNPGLVSKNLKADMVQTVQVYEDKDADGNPIEEQTKTINLKLKKGKKNGMFGDALAGYGTDERYEAGLRLNSFKNDRKVSFILNSNNINGTGFDFGFDNWHGDNYMFRNGSGNANDYYSYNNSNYELSEEGNLNRRNDAAITYFNEFKKKRKVSFDAGFNRNNFNSINKNISQNVINDSNYLNNESNTTENGIATTYYLSADFTRRIDTTGNVSLSISAGQTINTNQILTSTILSSNGNFLSNGINRMDNKLTRDHIEIMYKYARNSRKNKNLSWNIELMEVSDFSKTVYYQLLRQDGDTLNLKRDKDKNMTELHAKTGVRLPLYKDKLSYNISSDFYYKGYVNSQLSKKALNPLAIDFEQEYASKIDSLSIDFNNGFMQSSVVNGLIYRNKNIQMSAGVTYLNFILENNIVNGEAIEKRYTNYLPYFNMYNWNKKVGYLSLNINQAVDFPDANDLLPIQNLNNPFYLQLGNKLLKAQDKYNARLYYSKRKLKYLDLISLSISGNITQNYIAYSQQIGENGVIYQQPLNLNGYQSLGIYSHLEKTLKQVFNIEMNYQASFIESPLQVNGKVGYNNRKSHTLSPAFEFTISDNFDMEMNYSISFSNNKNSLNQNLNFNQITQNLGIDLRGVFWGKTEVSLSGNFNDQRQVPGIGKIIPLVNCYVQQPLDKAKKYNLKLTCFDIFKQNITISRTATNGGFIISESNQLQRYFMLTLVRKLNKSGNDEDTPMPVY